MFAEKVIQYCIGLSLILLMITYFLGENGRISYFPSYIIGIAGLGLGLLGRFNTFIQSTLFTSILLTTMLGYLCISILALGGGISTSLLYFGYSLLILSFVYGLVYSCLNMEWFRNVFLSTLIIAATVSALYSTYFFFNLDYQPLAEKRLYALGGLNNPVISAISYGAALSLCMSFFFVTKERGVQALTFLLGAVLIMAISLSGTRGVWIGLLAAGMTAIFLIPSKIQQRRLILIVLCLIPVSLIIAYLSGYSELVLKRSTSFRPEIWQATASQWLNGNILLGAGLQAGFDLYIAPNRFMHPHSLYLSSLYYGGIFGLGMLLVFIGRLFWVLLYKADHEVRVYALPLLVFGLTTLLFDGNRLVEKVDFLWLCFWLPVALTLLAESQPNRDT
ncbi:MAG: O-antigen ligase [Candidatus Azotimanducaceae bacterium]